MARQRMLLNVRFAVVLPAFAASITPTGPSPGKGLCQSDRNIDHTTAPRLRRKLFALPALFLLAAVVGSASLAGLAGASSPSGAAKFDAATWKPTLEAPLPPMESPLTFHLSDAPAYWYDNQRPDLEGILHTRSLSAAVAGVPTKVKFEIGEPLTSQ